MKSMEYRGKESAGQSEVHTTREEKGQLSIVNQINLLLSLSVPIYHYTKYSCTLKCINTKLETDQVRIISYLFHCTYMCVYFLRE